MGALPKTDTGGRTGLRFGVLGPLTVWRDGQEIKLGTVKQRQLLAVLLTAPNRTISLEAASTALWEDVPPRSAISNLRTYANKLRNALGAGDSARTRIVGRRPGYALRVEPGELDSAEFADRLRDGQAELARGAPRAAIEHLSAALALWRGRPVEDLPHTLALAPWADALEEQRCMALEGIAAARLSLGEYDTMVPELRDLLAVHPTRERLWCHLMLALYRSGDIAAALSAFGSAREILAVRLGVDPGPELVALHQAMLSRDPALTRAALPARPGGALQVRRRHAAVARRGCLCGHRRPRHS